MSQRAKRKEEDKATVQKPIEPVPILKEKENTHAINSANTHLIKKQESQPTSIIKLQKKASDHEIQKAPPPYLANLNSTKSPSRKKPVKG